MERANNRVRLAVALSAAIILAAIVGVVVALGGSGAEHTYSSAPERCLSSWNGSDNAQRLGQHQFIAHQYENVQVLALAPDYSEEVDADEPGSVCAVVFASASLDTELSAAAAVRVAGIWEGLNRYQPPEKLASLQSEAQRSYNGTLQEDGTIIPLE